MAETSFSMQNHNVAFSVAERNPNFYLAPLDAIWPPLLLLALAAMIGLVSAALSITWLGILALIGVAILIGDFRLHLHITEDN